MTFHVADFDSPAELAKFVNTEGVVFPNVVDIWHRAGRWYVFYWK